MQILHAILLLATVATGLELISAGPAGALDGNFQTIDDMGGYHFGYNDGRIARQEERSADGVVRGAYTYVDADGKIQVVQYTSDRHNGFLVSGTNIPKIGRIPEEGEFGEIIEKAPAAIEEDTEEVAGDLDLVRRTKLGEIDSVPVVMQGLPLPVEYTPEVAAARAAHLAAYGREAVRGMVYASQPVVQHVAPGPQFHPDYLPYAHL